MYYTVAKYKVLLSCMLSSKMYQLTSKSYLIWKSKYIYVTSWSFTQLKYLLNFHLYFVWRNISLCCILCWQEWIATVKSYFFVKKQIFCSNFHCLKRKYKITFKPFQKGLVRYSEVLEVNYLSFDRTILQ